MRRMVRIQPEDFSMAIPTAVDVEAVADPYTAMPIIIHMAKFPCGGAVCELPVRWSAR
ncbi:hypothetical protein [Propionibacterium acidifaciens]|uniref:hypothetical protein n=1 Tax=Propionibacterium acidifaciens TaxID=556499 RepID=UPI0039ECDD29